MVVQLDIVLDRNCQGMCRGLEAEQLLKRSVALGQLGELYHSLVDRALECGLDLQVLLCV